MFSASKLTPNFTPPRRPPQPPPHPHLPFPAPGKQQFIDSNNYPNIYRQGTHKYRNMTITTIIKNHFQRDNVKQIMSNSRPICQITILKGSLKEIRPNYLKEREREKKDHYVLGTQEEDTGKVTLMRHNHLEDNKISQK